MPTLAEQDFPDPHGVVTGLMAPAGTPKDIIERMAAELGRALKDASFAEHIQKVGAEPAADASPAEFSAFVAKEITLWARQEDCRRRSTNLFGRATRLPHRNHTNHYTIAGFFGGVIPFRTLEWGHSLHRWILGADPCR